MNTGVQELTRPGRQRDFARCFRGAAPAAAFGSVVFCAGGVHGFRALALGEPRNDKVCCLANLPTSIDDTLTLLEGAGYVADRPLATVLFLALKLGRPLFLEGEAGVGKT